MGYAVLKSEEQRSRNEPTPVRSNNGLHLCEKPFTFGEALPDESIWAGIGGNLRDAFFPKKQPPLRLTSRPVAVDDPLKERRSPAASFLAFCLHVLVVGLILWASFLPQTRVVMPKKTVITPITFRPYIPPVTPPAPKITAGGGGGGAHKIVEPSRGRIPPVQRLRVMAPQLIQVSHPLLPSQPSIVMPHMQVAQNMPKLGMPQSPQVAMASQGEGSNSGFGSADGGGIGSGIGAGMGPGKGADYGGGVMSVGGGVTAPQLVHSVQPEFTTQARAARYQGVVAIQLIVDQQGNPVDLQVVKHLGMGLDQKALAAVEQYRFRPAMYQGHPVPVRLVVDVNFHLY